MIIIITKQTTHDGANELNTEDVALNTGERTGGVMGSTISAYSHNYFT